MTKQEIIKAITENPVFYLATVEGDQPRVRGMLLYKADESGIVFHTAKMRELFAQIEKHNKVELYFNANGVQIRIAGHLELIEDNNLKDEIADHLTRTFLAPWRASITVDEFHNQFAVYRMSDGIASLWTMAKDIEPKEYVKLY